MEVVHNSYTPPQVLLPPGMEIYRDKFRDLVDKSLRCMQTYALSEHIRISASMIYLDKISKLVGKCHPAVIQANQLKGCKNTCGVVEIGRHIERLTATIPLLQNWLENENRSFAFHLILDRWRTEELSLEEIEIFACGIAEGINGMKKGDKYNFPAGSLLHATRLQLIKNQDGTFDLIHFNTGDGLVAFNGRISTAYKFPSIPANKLEDPETWRQFTKAQFENSMQPMLNFLIKLGGTPVDVDTWLKKPSQGSGSCVYMAILAEFKYSFISSFPTLHEGWCAYKRCKVLMLSAALEHDSESLSPIQKSLMGKKLEIRKRYLDWIESSDPSLIQTYINALILTGNSHEECEALIKGLSLPMSMSLLDKKINQSLDFASYGLLNKMPPYIGQKQRTWLQSSREDFPKTAAFLTEHALRDEIIKEGLVYDCCTLAYHMAQCSLSDMDRVFTLVETLKPEQKEHVLLTACQFSTDAGNYPKAFYVANLITSKLKRKFVIDYMATHFFRSNQIEQLIKTLELIQDKQEKNGTLEYWSTCYFLNGDSKGMKMLMERACEGMEKRRILLNICKLESDKGNVFEAVAYAHKIKSEPEKSAACLYIYNAMLKSNRLDEAEIIKASLLNSNIL